MEQEEARGFLKLVFRALKDDDSEALRRVQGSLGRMLERRGWRRRPGAQQIRGWLEALELGSDPGDVADVVLDLLGEESSPRSAMKSDTVQVG